MRLKSHLVPWFQWVLRDPFRHSDTWCPLEVGKHFSALCLVDDMPAFYQQAATLCPKTDAHPIGRLPERSPECQSFNLVPACVPPANSCISRLLRLHIACDLMAGAGQQLCAKEGGGGESLCVVFSSTGSVLAGGRAQGVRSTVQKQGGEWQLWELMLVEVKGEQAGHKCPYNVTEKWEFVEHWQKKHVSRVIAGRRTCAYDGHGSKTPRGLFSGGGRGFTESLQVKQTVIFSSMSFYLVSIPLLFALPQLPGWYCAMWVFWH